MYRRGFAALLGIVLLLAYPLSVGIYSVAASGASGDQTTTSPKVIIREGLNDANGTLPSGAEAGHDVVTLIYQSFRNLTQTISFRQFFTTTPRPEIGLGFEVQRNVTTAAYYIVNWYNGTKDHTTFWSYNLTTGTLGKMKDDVIDTRLTGFSGGTSLNWAGHEFHHKTSSGAKTQIGKTVATVPIHTISSTSQAPKNVPPGCSLPQATSMWVGASHVAGGGHQLMQTGVETQIGSSTWQYLAWYQFFDSMNYSHPYSYPTLYLQVPPGDSAKMKVVEQSDSSWIMSVMDTTTGFKDTYQTVYHPSFQAYFSQYIVETPDFSVCGYSGVPSQLAPFSNSVNFTAAKFCKYGSNTCWNADSTQPNVYGHSYYLSQCSNVQNTANHWESTFKYWSVEYLSSCYDWNWVV